MNNTMKSCIFALALTSVAQAGNIQVTVTNLAPAGGTFITPVWVGFHDGTFDTYDPGSPASVALERIAEDGTTSFLSADFAASGVGSMDGTLGMAPIGPGMSVSMMFNLNTMATISRYFSYASMVVPSNDAFIANGNPLAFPIFDAMGNFLGADFIVLGSMVRDAGTEVNDEIPMNTAFFGQMVPNTGTPENGVIHNHPGFLPAGSGGILDAAMFANADFALAGYQILRIRVEAVPEPATWALIALALPIGLYRARRRQAMA